MATAKTVYLVKDDTTKFLVRAPNPAQAVHHVARRFSVNVASQDELIKLVTEGMKVETAGEESGNGD